MIWLRSMTVFVSLKNSILALPLVRVYRVACYCGSKWVTPSSNSITRWILFWNTGPTQASMPMQPRIGPQLWRSLLNASWVPPRCAMFSNKLMVRRVMKRMQSIWRRQTLMQFILLLFTVSVRDMCWLSQMHPWLKVPWAWLSQPPSRLSVVCWIPKALCSETFTILWAGTISLANRREVHLLKSSEAHCDRVSRRI